MKPRAALAAVFASMALGCGAADVTVLSGGAVKAAFNEAAEAWQGATGHKVIVEFAPAGDIRRRVAAGERPDILIVPSENLEALAREGVIDVATRRDLAVVSIGLAVRKGAPVPDISTPEKLRQVLMDAKSLTYMDPARGTTGKHIDETVLPKLGIRDAVRSKTTLGEGGFIAEKVARGEIELAMQSMTELTPVSGVTIVGPLPDELQKNTVYSAVATRDARSPKPAQELLEYLASAPARKAFVERGYRVP